MNKGFTLLEMMVVLVIGLIMMTIIVPVVTVSTRVTKSVQTKLEVYQAARNILDICQESVQQAMTNERGGLFGIKSVTFTDTDSFTPPGDAPYTQSRREADGIWYVQNYAGGIAGNDYSDIPCALPHPLSHPMQTFPEYSRCVIASNLLGQTDTARKPLLADVSAIRRVQAGGGLMNGGQRASPAGTPQLPARDFPSDFIVPGNDLALGNYNGLHSSSGMFNAISVMDFDVAYWDAKADEFRNPPDNTAVYFPLPPKAIRITITVCDVNKRSRVTLSRVIHLMTGLNDGTLDPAQTAPDSKYFDAANNISQFNRAKDLTVLEPALLSAGP
jgi:prepilin-type N-terminal cleavage/methylation domain-containing protein